MLQMQLAGAKPEIIRVFDVGFQMRPKLAFAIFQFGMLELNFAGENRTSGWRTPS
jgi:hypothetical protein